MHWYITQNFLPTFSMPILFRHSFKTAIFSRFLKVTIATSLQNLFIKLDVAIATFKNLLKMAVLKECLRWTWNRQAKRFELCTNVYLMYLWEYVYLCIYILMYMYTYAYLMGFTLRKAEQAEHAPNIERYYAKNN